nr:YcnI family protein [Streptomyces sp. NBC_00830]
MSHITLPRTGRRLPLAATAAAATILFAAAPASAHVEVTSDSAQALAENVELNFVAASESATAGITELRVVLPEGLTAADVTYGEGPKGWKFAAGDDGYTVKGPAVKAGEDAEYSVNVRQLPDAKELVFKTLQTYSDGQVDRWIEVGESGGDHGHGNEAPVLKLKAAAPGAASVSPSPSESETTTASPVPAPTGAETSASPAAQAAEDTEEEGGLSAAAWTGIIAVVVIAAAAAAILLRRRNGTR